MLSRKHVSKQDKLTCKHARHVDTWVVRKHTRHVGTSASARMARNLADSISSKEFLEMQATIECGFTLKRERDMIRTYSQMHRTDNYSQHSSIIWPVWLNGWVFVYQLSDCGFETSCSHLQGVSFPKLILPHNDIGKLVNDCTHLWKTVISLKLY